jgi:hypothetical protein
MPIRGQQVEWISESQRDGMREPLNWARQPTAKVCGQELSNLHSVMKMFSQPRLNTGNTACGSERSRGAERSGFSKPRRGGSPFSFPHLTPCNPTHPSTQVSPVPPLVTARNRWLAPSFPIFGPRHQSILTTRAKQSTAPRQTR